MNINRTIEWLKLSPKYLFPIAIVTGFALFASTDVLNIFGLSLLITQIRPYLGGVFLLTVALLMTSWGISIFTWMRDKYIEKEYLQARQKRLHSLTRAEKAILRRYINVKTRTQYLSMNDGVVNGLEKENIIFKASEIRRRGEWAYNITSWAWEYLNNNSDLIE